MLHGLLWQTYRTIHDTLFPTFCSSCRLALFSKEIFCQRCTALIKPIAPKEIALTQSKMLTVFAVARYGPPLRDLIMAKANSDLWAARALAHLIWRHTVLPHLSVDYFIPVPLHWTRYAQRGYNQASIIAHELSILHGASVTRSLKRVHRTAFQSSLPLEQRSSNVASAFVLRQPATLLENLKGKHLVLVDDLMTTGSTLKYAAGELLHLKPASLRAVVGCRI